MFAPPPLSLSLPTRPSVHYSSHLYSFLVYYIMYLQFIFMVGMSVRELSKLLGQFQTLADLLHGKNKNGVKNYNS